MECVGSDNEPMTSSTSSSTIGAEITSYDRAMYGFDEKGLEKALYQRPWLKDPKYFKRVKV